MAFKQYKPKQHLRKIEPAFHINDNVLSINYKAIESLNMTCNKLKRASIYFNSEENKIKLVFHKSNPPHSLGMYKVNQTKKSYSYHIPIKGFLSETGLQLNAKKKKIKTFYRDNNGVVLDLNQ